MYLSDLLRGLLRLWYVVLGGLLVAAGLAYLVYDTVPVEYEANATQLLLPPQLTVGLEGGNPYLVLGGMNQALAILSTRVNAPEMRDRVLGEDKSIDYGTSLDTAAGAPFLRITTRASSEPAALALLSDIQALAADQLLAMQTELNIPPESRIGMSQVTADSEATPQTSTRMQLTVGAFGVGLVLTLVLTAALDGVLAARNRRREAANLEPPAERRPQERVLAADIIGRDRDPFAPQRPNDAKGSGALGPDSTPIPALTQIPGGSGPTSTRADRRGQRVEEE